MPRRLRLVFLLGLVIAPLGNLVAQAPASLTVAPATPKPGAVVRLALTVDAAGDSIVAVRGAMAGEPLHFTVTAPGRYGAIGAVPVDSMGPTTAEAIVERASGRIDTLRATVEPPPLPPPSEQLAVAPRFGQPMDSALEARVAAEAAKAREVGRKSHESPPLWTQPFMHPRPSAVTSRFGTGRTFNGVVTSRHLGVDFRGATGTPVFASNRGVVALLDTFFLGGRIAYVDHGAGVVTAYMHLSRFLVEVGDTVQRGQRIGLVGATGRVTGPHLHWAARYGSISVNPLDLVELETWGARRERAVAATRATGRPDSTLAAFGSDAELATFLVRYMTARQRILLEQTRKDRMKRGCTMSSRVAPRVEGDSVPAGAIIGGTVQQPTGEPIVGADVLLGSLGSAATDSSGRFRITVSADSLAAPRAVDLTARRIGFEAAVEPLTVARGDSIELTIRLCAGALYLSAALAQESESITNNQHAGVDEGGIVKMHRDHLVILRRGRLFTVALGDDQLRPVSAVDAFAPGADPDLAWYDEMLVHDEKVVVVGFNYLHSGTEISTFEIDSAGGLTYRSTYHLRSDDYYSSRNYASRLVGSSLVFYTPLGVGSDTTNPLAALPAFRKWTSDTTSRRFTPIAAGRVYRPVREPDPDQLLALHTVTRCDLAKPELECAATVVMGEYGRVSYVSPRAVYVWAANPGDAHDSVSASPNVLYRLPLDGSTPKALGVSGMPVDQFSFLESADRHLNVLVATESRGEGMWRAEGKPGDLALFRIPVSRFGDGRTSAAATRYRALPAPPAGAFQNRFVGGHLLYGAGAGWGSPKTRATDLHVVPWKGGTITSLALPHPVDRIEAMGTEAVVIGADSSALHFTSIRLTGRPVVATRYSVDSASQGESRSHGFFYRPASATSGLLGLPLRGPGEPGYRHLSRESASILFLRNARDRFEPLGSLTARLDGAEADDCKASCVDWYGNSRPIFVGNRIFALMGYELVEGRIEKGRMVEVRRVDYLRPHLAR